MLDDLDSSQPGHPARPERQQRVQFPLPGETHVPPERSRLERLRGTARPDLLRLALEQLLRAWEPLEVSHEDVGALERLYGVDAHEASTLRKQLFEDVLQAFLSDGALSSVEQRYLLDLKRALGLTRPDVQDAYHRQGAPQFRAALAAAIADRALTAEERAALAELASNLRLPQDLAAQAVESTARKLLDQVWDAVVRRGTLTPAMALRVREAAAALGIPLTPEQEQAVDQVERRAVEQRARAEAARMRFHQEQERLREQQRVRDRLAREQYERAVAARKRMDQMLLDLRSALSRGEVPGVEVSLRLHTGEVCHCMQPAEWHTFRGDPANRYAERHLVFDDTGVLYITNQRLVFEGDRRLVMIRLQDITSVTPQLISRLDIGRRDDPPIHLILQPPQRLHAVAFLLERVLATRRHDE